MTDKENGMSMKRINVAKALLAGAMVCGMAACASADVVAYWPFGISGLADASGNGHSLVKSDGGVVLSNGMARLDGTQTKFSTALPLDLSAYTNLTVEFWMRMTVATTNTGIMIEHTETFNSNAGAFMIDAAEAGAAGKVTGGFRTSSSFGYNLDETPANATTNGEWHHVAVVYNASKTGADRSMLYFDGVAQSTWSTFTNFEATAFCNAYFYIGSRANNSYRYVGDLDDIRISSTALTTNEFLLTRSAEDPRLVAYWPFDRGSELADQSGHSNTLVSGSGVVFSNGVAVLDGSQSTFHTLGSLDLTACTNLTIECFMRTTASAASSMVLEHSANATNNPGAFAVSQTGGALIGGFRTDDGGNYDSSGDGTALTNGAWHHVALVYDAASNGADRVRLYVDQVRQTSSAVYTNDVLSAFRNEILYIGTRANGEAPFTGELDDVRIVDAVLATNQFLKAHSVDAPTVLAYWPFARGNEKTDASGHGFSLALKSPSDVNFKDGAADFFGHSGLYTSTRFDLSSFKTVTIEGFFKSNFTNGSPILVELSQNYNGPAGTFCLSAGMFTNNAMGAGFKTTTGYNIETAAQGAFANGVWHHIAYVIDLTVTNGTDRARLYLDKVRQNKTNNSSTGNTPFVSDQQLFLGWRGSSADWNFIGDMDDVRITTAALSTNEFLNPSLRTEEPLTNRVIAYWTFDTTNGFADATGHGNTLTGGGVVFTNDAAVFGGASTVKTVNKLNLAGYSAVTVEYFIRTVSTGVQIMLEQSAIIGSNPGGFYSDVNEFNAGAVAGAFKTSNGNNIESSSVGTVNDGQWHHVAIIIDRAKSGTDRLQLYLDSVRQSKTGGFNSATDTSLINDYLYIGSRYNNTTFKYVGQLDDIRITGKALTSAEFLKRPMTVLPPVIAYWPFTRRHELEDASGNGNSLTNKGVTFNAAAGSAVFTGNQEVFGTAKTLCLYLYNALTMECFVRSSASANTQTILEASTNAPLLQGTFRLSALAGSGFAESAFTTAYYTYVGGSAYRYNLDRSDVGNSVTDGKWHHLALVIDSSVAGANRAKLFFDWVPQSYITNTNFDLTTAFLNAPFFIGSRANSLNKFAGELDDIRISGAALTADQFLTKRSSPPGTLLRVQ